MTKKTETMLVTDLSSTKKVSYQGSPYCLTEVKQESIGEERTPTENVTPSPKRCPHSLGYLSTHQRKEEIPQECMTCEKLMECMLFNLKKSEIAIEEI